MSFFQNSQSGQQQGGTAFGSSFNNPQPNQPAAGNLFGALNNNTQTQGGGLFGASLNNNTQQNPPAAGGLFGASSGNNQQQGGGLFGASLNNNTQQNQPATGGLFGASNNNNQQQGGGLFGASLNNAQQNQPAAGGLFGASNNNQQQGGGLFSRFGQTSQQQTQPTAGAFGASTNAFGISALSNQNPPAGGLFGSLKPANQNQQGQQMQNGGFNQMWQPELPHQKNVPDQIATIIRKWDSTSPDCVFRYYFYNKVGEEKAPYYGPSPNEDPKAWEEALSKKPGPGYIPVPCVGFAQMGERIKIQQQNLASFNQRLHEINNSLDAMLSKHDLVLSVRTLDAKRKHTVLKQRCLALATKVQIIRNKGYTMELDEQELKDKLSRLERQVCDPGLSARAEEIWARMVGVRERARFLKEEMGRKSAAVEDSLDEESVRRAEKVLEAYGLQVQHIKKELALIHEDLKGWEKQQSMGR